MDVLHAAIGVDCYSFIKEARGNQKTWDVSKELENWPGRDPEKQS